MTTPELFVPVQSRGMSKESHGASASMEFFTSISSAESFFIRSSSSMMCPASLSCSAPSPPVSSPAPASGRAANMPSFTDAYRSMRASAALSSLCSSRYSASRVLTRSSPSVYSFFSGSETSTQPMSWSCRSSSSLCGFIASSLSFFILTIISCSRSFPQSARQPCPYWPRPGREACL